MPILKIIPFPGPNFQKEATITTYHLQSESETPILKINSLLGPQISKNCLNHYLLPIHSFPTPQSFETSPIITFYLHTHPNTKYKLLPAPPPTPFLSSKNCLNHYLPSKQWTRHPAYSTLVLFIKQFYDLWSDCTFLSATIGSIRGFFRLLLHQIYHWSVHQSVSWYHLWYWWNYKQKRPLDPLCGGY